jgi:5-amino-6-(5-phosphoribosylamino)uracil reductase
MPHRPHMTVVLAMSVDGKIADIEHSPARFGSAVDKRHLETQIAQADGILFGAGTLRAYGTTLTVSQPQLLQKRRALRIPTQPVQIVCSGSGAIDPELRFFRQPVPRWLLTSAEGLAFWQGRPEFERVLLFYSEASDQARGNQAVILTSDWPQILQELVALGIGRLVVTGGGELVASLLAADVIDELWLTVCPLILGGAAPSLVAGSGFLESAAPRLVLLSAEVVGSEVFLHYRRAC